MKLKAIFSFHNACYSRKTGMRAATANSLGSHNYVQYISKNMSGLQEATTLEYTYQTVKMPIFCSY